VAPWTAVPALVALLTDPCREVSSRALRLLAREAEVHADCLHPRLSDGLAEAASFQSRLWAEFNPGKPQPTGEPRSAAARPSGKYSAVGNTFKGALLLAVDASHRWRVLHAERACGCGAACATPPPSAD
jgi:Sister chromatid cohesion C-terminus